MPLIDTGVASGGVMSGGLKENNRLWREALDRLFQIVPVEALLRRVIVWKLDKLDIEGLEKVSMVDWKIDFSRADRRKLIYG